MLALVSLYSRPDATLLQSSSNTLWSCQYQGVEGFRVVEVKSIMSVVAIVPLPHGDLGSCFVAEKLGLEVADLGGVFEEVLDE